MQERDRLEPLPLMLMSLAAFAGVVWGAVAGADDLMMQALVLLLALAGGALWTTACTVIAVRIARSPD